MFLEKDAIDYFRNFDIQDTLFRLERLPRPGNIPSRKAGRNMEFEKYSRYEPGDHLQDIDWKVYARSGKLFIKNYGLDIKTRVRIVLDCSPSMDYPSQKGTPSENKFHFAKKCAAILAYLLIRKQNTVRFFTLNDRSRDLGVAALTTINNTLKSLKTGGRSRLGAITNQKGVTTFLLSDGWWEDMTSAESALYLEQNGFHFLHILSPEEKDLSLNGDIILEDLEKHSRLPVLPSRIRNEYIRALEEVVGNYQHRLSRRGLLYRVFPTDRKYYVNLRRFLEQTVRQAPRTDQRSAS